MSFQVKVNASRTVLKFTELPTRIRNRLIAVITDLDKEAVDLAKQKAEGDLVNVISGKYVASIQGRIINEPKRIAGVIYSDARQADILEWGGVIPFHEILPNTATALAFMGGAGEVFAAAVVMPDVTIRKRGVMHKALYQMHQEILAAIGGAVGDEARSPA
jgi:hypothetical protein